MSQVPERFIRDFVRKVEELGGKGTCVRVKVTNKTSVSLCVENTVHRKEVRGKERRGKYFNIIRGSGQSPCERRYSGGRDSGYY